MQKRRMRKMVNMNTLLKKYKYSCDEYEKKDWLIDKVLYDLCRNNPSHNKEYVINAKVAIIGRTYATGIERMIASKEPKQQGNSMMILQKHFYDNRKCINPLLALLKKISEPLDETKLKKIVTIHGKLTQLISKKTRTSKNARKKLSPRSFVSKYMHFYCPAVPIFDDYAKRALTKHVYKSELQWFPENTNYADEIYAEYVARFWQFYQRIKKEIKKVKPKVKFSVKLVDRYLLDTTRKHN